MSAFSNNNQITPTDGNVLTIKTVQIAPFRTLMTALKDILLETNITFEKSNYSKEKLMMYQSKMTIIKSRI